MTITWDEVAELLAFCAVFDNRKGDELDVNAWHMIATDHRWTAPAAHRVAREHYGAGADKARLTPAAVTDAIRAARRQASDSFRVPDVPDELPAGQYPAWYRARLAEHIDRQLDRWAAGEDLSRAVVEPGGGPLAIEAAPAHLREQIARDIERIGSMPKPGPPALLRGPTLDPRVRAVARAELDDLRAERGEKATG